MTFDFHLLQTIHQRIEEDLNDSGLGGGRLHCTSCGDSKPIQPGDVANYLAHGWPKHCGITMRWITQRQIDEGEST